MAWPRWPRAPARGRLVAGRLLLALAAVAIVVVLLTAKRQSPVVQPIAFNHQKHSGDLQLACEFCHPYVTVSAHAGLPGGETCAICHLAPQGASPEAARLTELLTAGTPFRFTKLFRLAGHVNYTHRRHVGIARLECVECHGTIAATVRPPGRPLVRIDMDFCLSCHRAKGESLDCIACHR